MSKRIYSDAFIDVDELCSEGSITDPEDPPPTPPPVIRRRHNRVLPSSFSPIRTPELICNETPQHPAASVNRWPSPTPSSLPGIDELPQPPSAGPSASTTRGTRSFRNYCFTCHESPEVPITDDGFRTQFGERLQEFKGYIFQLERAPTTGQLHWQGVVWGPRKLTLAGAKAIFGINSIHLEPCKDLAASIRYCSKADSRYSLIIIFFVLLLIHYNNGVTVQGGWTLGVGRTEQPRWPQRFAWAQRSRSVRSVIRECNHGRHPRPYRAPTPPPLRCRAISVD